MEVCDQWLKNQPGKTTWRDVAKVVKDIGLYQLADGILTAYQTGCYLSQQCEINNERLHDSRVHDNNSVLIPV